MEASKFLKSRRDRLTPDKAGIPFYGGSRRVPGLRREEVAMAAGISVDYYTKLERGNLAGVSESIVESLADALQLDSAEREHLYDLVRIVNQEGAKPSPARKNLVVPDPLHRTIEKIDMPVIVHDNCLDIVATNPLGRALYSLAFTAAGRPNMARFCFFNPAARTFWQDWKSVAWSTVAMLHQWVGQFPQDQKLLSLIGELCTRSEEFAHWWASQDVKHHYSGDKTFIHPEVGRLDLHFETLLVPSERRLSMTVYSAPPGTPSADGLEMLAGLVATAATEQEQKQAAATISGDSND